MKRLARSKSGRLIYGQKWQNIDRSTESRIDDGLYSEISGKAGVPEELESPTMAGREENGDRILKGNRSDMESMYRAALVGDWLAAEIILSRDPNLARDYVTEEGDRVLHVAAAMKHKDFIEKLVERISREDLTLLDGRGNTACCYAAISDEVEIARVMIDKCPDLITFHDENHTTPLHKAASRGRTKMVLYFLELIKVEDLSTEEWFELLLFTIRREMYDVVIEIVAKNGYLATMANDEGTALHLLSRQKFSNSSSWLAVLVSVLLDVLFGIHVHLNGKKRSDFLLLAEKLWTEMQRLEMGSVLELIKNHNILHDAAKSGHVELVTMITRTYPQLIWDLDGDGYTIFHIAVSYRRSNVYNLIHHVGAMIDFSAISQDVNGDNILHLAAKLAPYHRRMIPQSALQMQRELSWFKDVEATVPPSCQEMRNKKGQTPRDLFSKEHKSLMEKSETWMRNTADSCMLIGTILLTVVFAAAFTVPGGNSSEGVPVLGSRIWFKAFIASEVLALFGSLFSIIMFWSIMTSNFAEEKFLYILPLQLMLGLGSLLSSIFCAISAFMAAIFLQFHKVTSMVWFGYCIFVAVYSILILVATSKFVNLGEMTRIVVFVWTWIRNRSNKHSLFRQHHVEFRDSPCSVYELIEKSRVRIE